MNISITIVTFSCSVLEEKVHFYTSQSRKGNFFNQLINKVDK